MNGALVLLVEDDRAGREMFAFGLEQGGFRVEQAHNGLQALDKALDLAPDIIVTDLAIPGIDGLQLCRQASEAERADAPHPDHRHHRLRIVRGRTRPRHASRLRCRLPETVPYRHSRLGNQPAPRDRAARLKPRVLLVEDYVDAREMYRDFLLFAGFDVETADNGEEAIQKARALDPDLILMDLSLPVLDGWEATRRLKADERTAAIKVVALSAHAMAAEERRATDAGCDGFIAKPCLPQELVAQVARHLSSVAEPSSPRRKATAKRP
jgi:CheY-like chemotaxis protein